MSDSVQRGGASASGSQRANLEPVSEDAHPPENRRLPTNPQMVVEQMQLVSTTEFVQQHVAPVASNPPPPPPAVVGRPPPPKPVAALPAPRRGIDRASSFMLGFGLGLLATLLPARQLARQHERELLAEPVAAVDAAIAQPLEVELDPDAIEAQLREIEGAARRRFVMIWLLAGIPLGLGLGFVGSVLLQRSS